MSENPEVSKEAYRLHFFLGVIGIALCVLTAGLLIRDFWILIQKRKALQAIVCTVLLGWLTSFLISVSIEAHGAWRGWRQSQ